VARKESLQLKDKVAVVTGAGRGIGEATARLFHEEGASLILLDQDESGLTELAASLGPDRVYVSPCDIGNEAQVEGAVQKGHELFGRIDVLANIAAIRVKPAPVTEIEVSEWDRILRVNITGVAICAKHVIPLMGTGGSVINVSSVHATIGRKSWAAYDATRAAVLALSRDMAQDHGVDGIRVNVVAPGPVITGFHVQQLARQERIPASEAEARLRALPRKNVMNRAAEPIEVARAILFLASDNSSFMTASVMNVDGGY
jgi:NAD(P)-dependent dehydrogenase (short-subunit alcohol dehydrogenase family)